MRTITLTHQALADIIADAVSQGIRTYELSKSGEISYRKAVSLYGQWFVDVEKQGLIRGLRRGDKANSKIVYQVAEIEALRRKEIAKTSRIIETK